MQLSLDSEILVLGKKSHSYCPLRAEWKTLDNLHNNRVFRIKASNTILVMVNKYIVLLRKHIVKSLVDLNSKKMVFQWI